MPLLYPIIPIFGNPLWVGSLAHEYKYHGFGPRIQSLEPGFTEQLFFKPQIFIFSDPQGFRGAYSSGIFIKLQGLSFKGSLAWVNLSSICCRIA